MVKIELILGDCIEEMGKMPENSVDSIITDPPYGLAFMGKEWDKLQTKQWHGKHEAWQDNHPQSHIGNRLSSHPRHGMDGRAMQEWHYKWAVGALRVARPGATLVAFGGSRTHHRLMCAIEDAGWIIKDILAYLYGSGFPKATDISKQLDKRVGVEREVIGHSDSGMGNTERSIHSSEGFAVSRDREFNITAFLTEEAKLWDGWKSHGLKPAIEIICLAMKANEGSYADNAMKHGVSGLNIDGARLGTRADDKLDRGGKQGQIYNWSKTERKELFYDGGKGRYPANVIFECLCDEVLEVEEERIVGRTIRTPNEIYGGKNRPGASIGDNPGGKVISKAIIHTNPECPCYMLDRQSGRKEAAGVPYIYSDREKVNGFIGGGRPQALSGYSDGGSGGASRFFYCAKASHAERNRGFESRRARQVTDGSIRSNPDSARAYQANSAMRKNTHPTVKPLELMKWLCLLTKTPTGGVVLDPFMGSGTTGMACKETARDFIGIELNQEYYEVAKKRVAAAQESLF